MTTSSLRSLRFTRDRYRWVKQKSIVVIRDICRRLLLHELPLVHCKRMTETEGGREGEYATGCAGVFSPAIYADEKRHGTCIFIVFFLS